MGNRLEVLKLLEQNSSFKESPELFGNQKIRGTWLETTNLEERIWRKTTNKNIQSLGSTPSFAPTSLATFSIYYGTRRPGYLVTEQQTFFTGVCVCSVAQLCPALCDSMGCSPPGSSVHGISQTRILEWVASSFSRGSSWPRDRIFISCIAGGFFTTQLPGKPSTLCNWKLTF